MGRWSLFTDRHTPTLNLIMLTNKTDLFTDRWSLYKIIYVTHRSFSELTDSLYKIRVIKIVENSDIFANKS